MKAPKRTAGDRARAPGQMPPEDPAAPVMADSLAKEVETDIDRDFLCQASRAPDRRTLILICRVTTSRRT
jgi:hypothetical protein